MNKKVIALVGLLVAFALFIAVNILGTALLHGARADLTENKLFTLSKGSKNIAAKLDEPIKLTLYYSESKSSDVPAQFKSYGQRVKEVLREYALASGGKIKLEIVSPEAFSEVEDKAVQDGLAGLPIGRSGDRFYFGLVGTNSTDKKEIIPIFDPSKEEFLEYDITRLIYLLSNTQKKPIGVLTWLPIDGVQNNPLMRGQNTPPWQIMTQIREMFDVKTIANDAAELPADVKVILVCHPKGMSDKMQYLLDQFVLKGGRLLVFVDPYCEADLPPGINPMQAMNIPHNSDLKKLFDAWGIELTPEKFVGDRTSALKVQMGSQNRPETVSFIAWLGLTKDKGNFDSGDSVTGTLQQVNMAAAGALTKKAGSSINFQPIIQSTTDSMLVDTKQLQLMPDPKKMLADFKPNGELKYTLAARLSGKVKSAFPAGDPNKPAGPDGKPTDQPQPGHIAESAEDLNVIVVADCDMLTDRFWVQESRLGNILLGYQKMADNGDFVIGALDNLSGSSDMISVRARGKFQRPFDKVEQIQKEAEQKFLAKKNELDQKLQEADKRLGELQGAGAGANGKMLLTPEQQAEIEKIIKAKVETRKEQRDVAYQMRKDVQGLETKLKVLNMATMPVAVGVLAVGLSIYRVNRRRSSKTQAPKGLS
jgi:ABC-type uncharacterized transport system involved in gliding motility auxiliary subunit